MAKLIVKSGTLAGTALELKPGTNSVGRTSEADICIPDPSVSTQHCELNVADIGVAVHDFGSTNGTFVNGERVARGMLQTGDSLTVGDVQLTVELPEVHIALPTTEMAEAPGAAFLADGSPACFNHREVAALYRCTKCENWWCGECVRALKRLSGDFIHFCPDCSAACAGIPTFSASRKRTFFQRVGDTLRLPRREK